MNTGGIDMTILRGASLDHILIALANAFGLSERATARPDDDFEKLCVTLLEPLHARISALSGGDCDFKVDLDGSELRENTALARKFAASPAGAVVIFDESKPDPISAILLRPGADDIHGYVEDDGDGMWFRDLIH